MSSGRRPLAWGEEEANRTTTRVGEEMRARRRPTPKKMGAGRWLDPEEMGCWERS